MAAGDEVAAGIHAVNDRNKRLNIPMFEIGEVVELPVRRKRRGSVRGFAKLLREHGIGGTRETLQRYLRGDPEPPTAFLHAVAPLLDVRTEYLVKGEGKITEDAEARSRAKAAMPPAEEWPDQVAEIFDRLGSIHVPAQGAAWFAWSGLSDAPIADDGPSDTNTTLAEKLVTAIKYNAELFGISINGGVLDTPAGTMYVRLLGEALVALHWASFQQSDFRLLDSRKRVESIDVAEE